MKPRGIVAAAWVLAVLWAAISTVSAVRHGWVGVDSHAYWNAWRGGLYDVPPGMRNAYLYSPAFAQVTWPLTLLSWPVFGSMWALGLAASFWWLFAPFGWRWAVPGVLACAPVILGGNVYGLFAVVLVLGFRYPAVWALPLLTKIAPGVGLIWFAVRREWRELAVALGATGAIAAVSAAFAPHLWRAWFDFLTSTSQTGQSQFVVPLWLRLTLAVLVMVVAARRGWAWAIPVAVFLSSPMLGIGVLSIFAAVPRLLTEVLGEEVQRVRGTRADLAGAACGVEPSHVPQGYVSTG